MEPDPTHPPELTAKDAAKVDALIDPNPLPCGGRGLVEGTARTERWSFGKRSTVAVARYRLGMGWPPKGAILRRTCPVPEVSERCLTHRTDDGDAVAPRLPLDAPNTVPESSERTSTPPGGNTPVGQDGPDATVLRSARWATTAADGGHGNDPPPHPGHGAPPLPPPGGTHGLAPVLPLPLPPGGTDSQPPEGGLGVEDTQGQGAGEGQRRPRRPSWSRPRAPHPTRATVGRLGRVLAAVAVAWALIFAAGRCTAALSGIDLPDVNVTPGRPNDNPPAPPAPTEPPTETTAPTPSSIGPVFRVCPPSWETTTVPVEGCP